MRSTIVSRYERRLSCCLNFRLPAPSPGRGLRRVSQVKQAVHLRIATESRHGLSCFLSFLGLELDESIGTLAIVVFLIPWIVIVAPRLNQFGSGVIRNWPLLALPGIAILSVFWSRDPLWTLRSAIEYMVTFLIGIAAANCVSRRTLLSALMIALTVVDTAGTAYALYTGHLSLSGGAETSQEIGGFGGSSGAVSGLFGSKNELAGASAVQFLIALCFLCFDKNRIVSWTGYFLVALLGLFSFYLGRSGGALVSLLACSIFNISTNYIQKKPVSRANRCW